LDVANLKGGRSAVPDQAVLIGSFTDVERAADALDHLRALGIQDRDITVMSSVPQPSGILERPRPKTLLPWISLGSAGLGLAVGLFFAVITPYLYVIRVGNQPISPTPPTLLLLYEFTMLFMIAGTLGGMLLLNHMPPIEPQYADPMLSAGRTAVLFQCPDDKKKAAVEILEAQGAQDVHEPERRKL
jgi:hypothetical protein